MAEHQDCLLHFAISLGFIYILSQFKGLKSEGLQNQYLGCFYVNANSTTSKSPPEKYSATTIANCIDLCRERTYMYTYAEFQNGINCMCRDDYGSQVPDRFCNIECAGNRSSVCGWEGHNFVDPVYDLYAVCPVGTYGLSHCENACHCDRQVPCNIVTGACPAGCQGNFSGPSCSTISLSERYIGCYEDNNDNRSMGNPHYPGFLTLETCVDLCASLNSTYAGGQFSVECVCADSYDKHGRCEESNSPCACNMTCSKNRSQICGGGSAISVYSVCPAGYYEKNCRQMCNCASGECYFRNGSCLNSTCKSGWTGQSCDVRDCEKNNGDCESEEKCEVVDLNYANVSVCRCREGFRKVKLSDNCADIDECSEVALTDVCGQYAINCTNTFGSYKCVCGNGTHDDRGRCSQDKQSRNNSESVCNVTTAISSDVHNHNSVVIPIVLVCCISIAVATGICCLYRRRRSTRSVPQKNATSRKQQEHFELDENPYATYYSARQAAYTPATTEVDIKQLPEFIQYKLSHPGILEKEFKLVPMETKDPCNVGKQKELKPKNRFKNIIPYDHNRVVLKKLPNEALSEYINASYIKGIRETDKFIATQGPRPQTVVDFWRMICETNVDVIVMITNLEENRKVKCEKYWSDVGASDVHGGVSVKTTSEKHFVDYTSRQLHITTKEKSFQVQQWHYLSWPDHGVPLDTNSFLNFRRRVRLNMTPGKTTVVHCSAGAGRTGCFVAIDYLLERGQTERTIDVFSCFQSLRQQRAQMVQNLEQYRFVHMAVLIGLTVGETTIANEKFPSKLRQLQQIDRETGFCVLDAQYQFLKTTQEQLAGKERRRVVSGLIEKNKMTEMDGTYVTGWKAKDSYMTLNFPTSALIHEFYTLCREYKCKAVIFLDAEMTSEQSIFPTTRGDILLHQHTVECESSSTEEYGICYKIAERRKTDDTYANLSNTTIYANCQSDNACRQMNVYHVTESVNKDSIGFPSLVALYKHLIKLNETVNRVPAIVVSRTGFSLVGFCLAAFYAFDMSREDKEVDILQTVQEIRKCRDQLEFSLYSFKELYTAVGQFIQTSGLVEN